MKNVMLAEPAVIGLLGLGLFVLVCLLAILGAVVFLIVHFSRKSRKPAPPSASPVAPANQITSRKCPQCGAELKPDVSEGLCPACLLQRGIATEGGAPPGTPPFTPPTIPDLAKLFPQLEILELIGKGGMGAVYKARQPALDRFVALKILAPRSGGDLDFAERFTREARALAKLSHPNIVAVHDFGTAGQASSLSPSEISGGKSETGATPVLHYFIMEFMDGPNLRQVEQAGRLSPREALEIIPQICGALQFAHDEGIVHRDIKPENVLLDKKGRVKIADFGLAKILGQEPKDFRLTGVRDVVGTPHYMAPEQIEKPSEVDHRADIYSLGVVFYEMLTGELPLGKFQPPSSCAGGMQIDVRLDEVVLHALEKEPARRYQQVSEVKTRVETIAMTSRSSGHKSAPTESQRGLAPAATAPPLRRGVRVGVGVFLAVVILATVITFLLPESYVGIARLKLAGASPQNYDPYRLQTEFEVIESSVVLKPVADSLNLGARWSKMFAGSGGTLPDDEVVELMKRQLFLQPVRNTSIFEIRYYSQSPKEAAEIANKIAGVYCALSPGHRGEIIDPATVPLRPVKPNRPLNIFIGVVAGGIIGILTGGVVGLFMFWRGHASQRAVSPPPIQKPNHFWRRFAVTVLALVISIPMILIFMLFLSFAGRKQFDNPKPLAVQNTANRPADASAETWSPALAPGEKPDLQKILDEAKTFMEQHKYEESLQRHLWHFNHAQEFNDPYQNIVRLTSGLSDWEELGRHYPKAKQALMEIRDSRTQQLAAGQGYSEMLHEVQAINHELQDDDATVALIKTIHTKDPKLTGQNYFWMEDLLLQKGEYDLLLDCMGNPQAHFESARRGFETQIQSQQRMEEMRKQYPAPAPRLPRGAFVPPDMGQMATNNFVGQVCKLVEILVATGHQADAEKIRDQAVVVLDDARLKSAVSDAEEKIRNRAAPRSKSQTQDAVSAAQKWLALIDGGNYSETWKEASAIFRSAVTEPGWENSMNTFRQPLGDLVSRKLKSAQPATELPGAPDGQYVVMQFETSFAGKKSTIETVTFMLEKDGQWRSAGYFIK